MSFQISAWFYSIYKDEDKKFPSFIKDILSNQNGICPKPILYKDCLWVFVKISSDIKKCEVKNNSIVFKTIKNTQIQCNFPEHISPTKFIILRHGFSEEIKICVKGIPLLDFDYSRSDPDYDEQWKMINKALNWEELYKIVNRWILSHQVDPLRRIKHRAINLFLPLSTDIQFLLEIWQRKDFSRAKTHLKELEREWSDEKSPVSVLYRLWYMLVGDHLNWKEGDLPEKPTDVSLPKDKEGIELSLYEWLTKYFVENQFQKLEEWQKLLGHSQIDQLKEGRFDVISGSGVYCFSKMLTREIEKPEKIKPDESANGFDHNKTFYDEFNSFLKWLNDLNNTFESLIKTCQKKS